MMIGIIIFLIFFAILANLRLDLALLFIIATLPSYLIRFKILNIPTTLLEIMILMVFALWLAKAVLPNIRAWAKDRKNRAPYPFHWEIILLLIISFVAAGVSGFSLHALGIWKAYFFEPILLFILILNILRSKKSWQKILWALLMSAALVSFLAIFQKITGQYIFNSFWAKESARRVVSWFGYPNAIGLYLAPLIMLFIGWFFYLPRKTTLSRSLEKLLIIAIIITSLLAVYFARSEGALIGIMAGLIIFSLLAGQRQRTTAIVILIIIATGISLHQPTKTDLINKLTLRDLSGEIRQQQWKETWQMLKHGKIISGAGLDNYQTAIKKYHQPGIFFNRDQISNFDSRLYGSAKLRKKYWQPVEIYLYPHNIFLNFWTELGLLGALLFTWLIAKYCLIASRLIRIYHRNRQREKYLVLGLLGAMIAIVVHGLVDVPYFKNDLAIIFWILLALLGMMNFQQKKLKN